VKVALACFASIGSGELTIAYRNWSTNVFAARYSLAVQETAATQPTAAKAEVSGDFEAEIVPDTAGDVQVMLTVIMPDGKERRAFQNEGAAVWRLAQAIQQALDRITGECQLELFATRTRAVQESLAYRSDKGGGHIIHELLIASR